MDIQDDAVRLKIYVGESDRCGNEPAYKAVVHFLREKGVWGASVTRGVYGYGKRNLYHATSPLRLSEDLPMLIETVDSRKKILPLIPALSDMIKGGLITLEDVKILRHIG